MANIIEVDSRWGVFRQVTVACSQELASYFIVNTAVEKVDEVRVLRNDCDGITLPALFVSLITLYLLLIVSDTVMAAYLGDVAPRNASYIHLSF